LQWFSMIVRVLIVETLRELQLDATAGRLSRTVMLHVQFTLEVFMSKANAIRWGGLIGALVTGGSMIASGDKVNGLGIIFAAFSSVVGPVLTPKAA